MGRNLKNEFMIEVGSIALLIKKDVQKPPRYRIIYANKKEIVLCEMDTAKLNLILLGTSAFCKMVAVNDIVVQKDEPPVFAIESLPEAVKVSYIRNREIVEQITKAYGPDFLDLQSRKPKPLYQELCSKYNVTRKTICNLIRKYLQGGMTWPSLIDSRHFASKKGYRTYTFKTKNGRKSKILQCGKLLTEDDIQHFEESLKNYKSGRTKTIQKCYDLMNAKHYSNTVQTDDGSVKFVLRPVTERPTFDQFYYYFHTHLSKEEKDAIKTSRMEQRNNKRLLLSDSRYQVIGPCDRVQMDEVEADISLRSSVTEEATVGRPIVYMMHDVYSGIILALSVAFDNNSILGMTNCFLNLVEDKVAYCQKYGINISGDMWPSGVLPKRILTDRGSEYRSSEAVKIFNELNIHRELAPAGTGSLKGMVEQLFHEMHTNQNPYIESKGLIEKRHDSKHHEEATLTIDEFIKILLNFVIKRNNSIMSDYPLTKDMIAQNVNPVPVQIWKYGCEKYGYPEPIRNIPQYLFTLMTRQSAVYSRKGICCNHLYYLNDNDSQMLTDMYNAQNKRVPFEVRMDPRDIGAVYYIRDNRLQRAGLNSAKTGQVEFAGMTLYEWKAIETYLRIKMKNLEISKQQYDAYLAQIYTSIVTNAKKVHPASTENLEENRRLEKNFIASRMSMFGKINKYLEENTGGKPDLNYVLPEADDDIAKEMSAEISDGTAALENPTAEKNDDADSDCPDPTKDVEAYLNYIMSKGDYFM